MNKKLSIAATLALGLLCGPPAAYAAVLSSVELGLSTFNRTDTKDCTGCVAEASGGFGIAPFGYSANGIARASADHGTLRAFGRFDAFGQHTGQVRLGARASATFDDSFAINNVALNGLPGTVSIPIPFLWDVTPASSNPSGTVFSASNKFFVKSLTPFGIVKTGLHYSEDFDSSGSLGTSAFLQTGSLFTAIPFTFQPTIILNFVFGQEIKIISTLEIGLFATDFNQTGITSLFGIDDAGHSAYWGGFQSVLDASGNPVLDYTVSSASGTDWSRSSIPIAAVPEPTTFALMLLGLTMVLTLVVRPKRGMGNSPA